MATTKIKTDLRVEGELLAPNETASRALQVDSFGKIKSSSVTSTELGYVSGVTSAIQTQINSKAADSAVIKKDGSVAYTGNQSLGGNKLTNVGTPSGNGEVVIYDMIGANNGVASLDAGGKIPASQLPNSVMEYKGSWNASTNSPSLADGVGNAGDVYLVSVAGSQDLGSGSISFSAGDWAVYNGSIWEKSINSNAVVSVNGQTGVVSLSTSNISEGSNLYFTDERAQDAIGTALTDSSSIDFTYNDGANTITAAVIPGGVDHDSLLNFVANEHIDHSSVSINTSANSGLAGGGDITTSRSLSIDASNLTASTSADDADSVVIYDNSASGTRKMTRANFLSGVGGASAGDINETSFSAANNQVSAADVTGLAFSSATVRGFEAIVSVAIDATSDLFETFTLLGINKGSSFDMSIQSVGDDSGISFSITSGGQVQYTSTNVSGFVSNTIKFRARTTSV